MLKRKEAICTLYSDSVFLRCKGYPTQSILNHISSWSTLSNGKLERKGDFLVFLTFQFQFPITPSAQLSMEKRKCVATGDSPGSKIEFTEEHLIKSNMFWYHVVVKLMSSKNWQIILIAPCQSAPEDIMSRCERKGIYEDDKVRQHCGLTLWK